MITNLKATNKEGGKAGQVSINAGTREKINMYDEHPTNVISLYEFHQTALNRLQVLRKIEFM